MTRNLTSGVVIVATLFSGAAGLFLEIAHLDSQRRAALLGRCRYLLMTSSSLPQRQAGDCLTAYGGSQ